MRETLTAVAVAVAAVVPVAHQRPPWCDRRCIRCILGSQNVTPQGIWWWHHFSLRLWNEWKSYLPNFLGAKSHQKMAQSHCQKNLSSWFRREMTYLLIKDHSLSCLDISCSPWFGGRIRALMDNMLRCSNLICGAWREVSITSTGSVFRKMSLKCKHFPNLTVGRGGITIATLGRFHGSPEALTGPFTSGVRQDDDRWLDDRWLETRNSLEKCVAPKTFITAGGWLLDDCEKWLAEQPSREFLLFDWKNNDPVVDSQISTRVQKPDLSWKKWWRGWSEASWWSQFTPPKWVVAEERIP